MSAGALVTRKRIVRLTGFASTQVVVQAIGFLSGIVLVRHMEQVQYGYYTLAVSMVAIANILTDLGLATAVMAVGGPLATQSRALGAVMADANALHGRLVVVALLVITPCFAAMLWRQQMPLGQLLSLLILIAGSAWLNVRFGMALQIARLQGQVALQQRLDLGINTGRLLALLGATALALDATVACVVNLLVAGTYFVALRGYLARHVEPPAGPDAHTPALVRHIWKQAPNSIYFVISSQLSVWLIGVFGSSEQVAEVGALSRLAALFVVVGSVSTALVLPYFARNERPATLTAGFASVNAFFALMLAALLAACQLFPDAILWVLGPRYAELQDELTWMVLAATLSAWGGTLYSIGCARGWVVPAWLTVSTGIAATVGAACVVDVSTVKGSFMIIAATGTASTLIAFGYVASRLRLHALRLAGVAVP